MSPLGKSASAHCRPMLCVLNLWQQERCVSEHLLRALGVCFHSRLAAGARWDSASRVWIFWCQNINPLWGVIMNSLTPKAKSATASGIGKLESSWDTCPWALVYLKPVTFPKCRLLNLSGQWLNEAADGAAQFTNRETDIDYIVYGEGIKGIKEESRWGVGEFKLMVWLLVPV